MPLDNALTVRIGYRESSGIDALGTCRERGKASKGMVWGYGTEAALGRQLVLRRDPPAMAYGIDSVAAQPRQGALAERSLSPLQSARNSQET